MKNKYTWTVLNPFPSPIEGGYLNAPYGAGVYELINIITNERVYVGEAKNVAWRMTSLLPEPFGVGIRNNRPLRKYILENLKYIQYRTLACKDKLTAKKIQDQMIDENTYLFN